MDVGTAVLIVFSLATVLYMFLVYRGVGVVKSLVMVLVFVKIFAGVLYLVGVDRPLFIVHTRVGSTTITAMQLLLFSALFANLWLWGRAAELEKWFRAAALAGLILFSSVATVATVASAATQATASGVPQVTQVLVKKDPGGTQYDWYVAPLCTWQEYVPGYGYQTVGLVIAQNKYSSDNWVLAKGYKHFNVFSGEYWTVTKKYYDLVLDKFFRVYFESNGTYIIYIAQQKGKVVIGPLPCNITGNTPVTLYQGVVLSKHVVHNGDKVINYEQMLTSPGNYYVQTGWMGGVCLCPPTLGDGEINGYIKYNISIYKNYQLIDQEIVNPGAVLGPYPVSKFDIITVKGYAIVTLPSTGGGGGSPGNPGNTPSNNTSSASSSGNNGQAASPRIIEIKKEEAAAIAVASLAVDLIALFLAVKPR